jgi:hypothetical protein
MASETIPAAEWTEFLDSFSRSHAGWLTTLQIVSEKAPVEVEARRLPLEGIVADEKDAAGRRISIFLGWEGRTRLTHAVVAPSLVRQERTEEGADVGLELVAGDGTKTVLRFFSPTKPALADGLPGHPHPFKKH